MALKASAGRDSLRDKAGPAYKQVTLQQLRGFCETVRLGSLKAAADLLGLSHPTVWKQVHALERQFGVKLVEPHARGCRPTEAGQLLAELAMPLATGIDDLHRTFQTALPDVEAHLVIATSPRALVEDLPACIQAFERRWPHARLTLKEVRNEEVDQFIEAGEADLGFTAITNHDNPWLAVEPCYELDVILVTPPDHPLARRRRVRPEDLRGYPLVNAPSAFGVSEIAIALKNLGLFQTGPRRVETFYAAAIRHYVRLGYGIGILGGLPGHTPEDGLHERSLSRYFGRLLIYLVRRKGMLQPPPVRDFAETVRTLLSRTGSRSDNGPVCRQNWQIPPT